MTIDLSDWVDQYGDPLFRFAMIRLQDRLAAEDAVQETFLAALCSASRYRGDCQPSTWLFSILRNKIADHFRSKKPEANGYDPEIVESPTGASLNGRPLQEWDADPKKIFENREFWSVFNRCAQKLPEKLAEAYFLRELDGHSPNEVCEILEISPTNLSMRVYRARLLMRHCLERHWFDAEKSEYVDS